MKISEKVPLGTGNKIRVQGFERYKDNRSFGSNQEINLSSWRQNLPGRNFLRSSTNKQFENGLKQALLNCLDVGERISKLGIVGIVCIYITIC